MAFTSIISLLDNIDEKIRINLMNDFNLSAENLPIEIRSHENLDSYNFIQFNDDFSIFPNTKRSHVSRATYYRLFLEDYFDNEFEEIIYLDSDTVIIKNPLPYFKNMFNEMNKDDKTIACFPHFSTPTNDPRCLSIGIKSGLYFNAGVMLINIKNWKRFDIKKKSKKIIYEKKDKLMLWDQDVLNIIFDGNFSFLDSIYNYSLDMHRLDDFKKEKIENQVYILHYFGKVKPWNISGIKFNASEYYQREFRKIYPNKYHIVKNRQIGIFKPLIDLILNKELKRLKYPKSFIYETFISLFK